MKPRKEQIESSEKSPGRNRATDEKFIAKNELVLNLFVKKLDVEGLDHIKELSPEKKVVLASNHFSELDVPAIVSGLGEYFDLQITAMSPQWEKTGTKMLMDIAGSDRFSLLKTTPRDKESGELHHRGNFRPEDFSSIGTKIREGRTPWISLNNTIKTDNISLDRSAVGPVYLAHKNDAVLLPVAIVWEGTDPQAITAEGIANKLKLAGGKLKGRLRIGAPVDLGAFDQSKLKLFEDVLLKRGQGLKITAGETRQFKQASKLLHEQADEVGAKVASLLPDEQRGYYR